MKKVICTSMMANNGTSNNTQRILPVTVDKEYEVIGEADDMYSIINDNNNSAWYYKNRLRT